MYIGDWMERGERYYPDAVAVVVDQDSARDSAGDSASHSDVRRYTYREMNQRANRLACWLRRRAHIGRGDRVAILARNRVEYLDALFACGKLGAVLVPFNWRAHPREIAALVARTTPSVLLYEHEFSAAVELARAHNPCLAHLVCLAEDVAEPAEGLAADSLAGSLAFGDTQLESDAAIDNPYVDAEDILLLLFTGGTTGLPKAARVSYRMIAWNTLNTLVHELERGDVTITHTPMFHTGGLLVYTVPLLTLGGTVVIMRKWTAARMLALIERERATVLFCVPTQYRVMMDCPEFAHVSLASVRFLTSGGAPLPRAIISHYRQTHGVVFKQGFGMTEFGPGVFSMAPEHAEHKAGSIGRPNYFIDARVCDEANEPVATGEVGELVLKGPSMCSGYFGDDAAEAERAVVDEHGFFHTGDLARVDGDGFYFITDRKKDMYISGGENVYPAEVERVLYEHPSVAQCAVIGVPDARWGEVGRAYVVCAAASETTGAQLIEHCRDRLARYKVPHTVVFVDELPMSAAGKILKRELRARAVAEMRSGMPDTPTG